MDAQHVINLLHTNTTPHSSLLNDCRFLIRQLHKPKVSYIYRENNTVADGLAHFGMALSGSNITFLSSPPPIILNQLQQDQQHNLPMQGPGVTFGVPQHMHSFCQPSDRPSSNNACSSSSSHSFDVLILNSTMLRHLPVKLIPLRTLV